MANDRFREADISRRVHMTVVYVPSAFNGDGAGETVSEFLRNEHFDVVWVDMEFDAIELRRSVGQAFKSCLVCVASGRIVWESLSAAKATVSRILRTEEYFSCGNWEDVDIGWIDFNTHSATLEDYDSLLRELMISCLTQVDVREVREMIAMRSDELQRRTIARYESPGFMSSYWSKWKNQLPETQLARFLSFLPSKSYLLDAGCGPGHHSLFMRSHGHQVVGMDIANAALTCAREDFTGGVLAVQGDILSAPFGDGVFNGIWCCACLVHFPVGEVLTALCGLRRIVRPTGFIAFSVSVGKRPAVDLDGRFFESFDDGNAVEAVCIAAGLNVVDTYVEMSHRTTTGGFELSKWMTVFAQRSS